MISTNQFRSGLFIKLNGQLYMIVESQHHKPGKGGAFVRTKLKNLKQGTVIDRTFRAGETVEDIFIEERRCQYLYADDRYHFMDSETYEQFSLSAEQIGESKNFLTESTEVTCVTYKGEILNVKLPMFMELKVIQTEPGVRGDTVKGGSKNAKLETGATIQVPLFINNGDIVRIDTRSGEYVGRA